MRKVELTMKEDLKYLTIKKLVETNGNKKRAAVKINCSLRNIDRFILGYNDKGKSFFVHGNRGRRPFHALSEEQKNEIEQLYLSKYYDCSYTLFAELLRERENISISIDDATGTLVGLYFDNQETLNGYYHITNQILLKYGIPYKFKTDRRTVFEYKKKGSSLLEEDTFTQFAYACQQLGIELKTSSVPEFKPRIERVFQTLQQRLPQELRLANISTIDQANIFLKEYIKKFNKQFALYINHIKSVFEKQEDKKKINLILAILTKRVMDRGHSIQFDHKYYRLVNHVNTPIYFNRGTTCIVIKSFDNKLYATVDETIFALQVIPEVQAISENFDKVVKEKTKRIYIPPMLHPWKQQLLMHIYKNKNII